MKKYLLVFLFSVAISVKAQSGFFPGGLNIQPFTANYLEPKLGFLFNLSQSTLSDNQNTLRLEIGNSIDIYRFGSGEKGEFSVGADLFTYSRLRSEEDFKFPVETIDYLFGLNFGYKRYLNDNRFFGVRIRLSHISAHLVDGLYRSGDLNAADKADWTNSFPFVYSKEFIEIMPFFSVYQFRVYSGFTYNYNIKPSQLGKNTFQLGFDYFYSQFNDSKIYPFAAYDFRLTELIDYETNHSINLGIKFGSKNASGFSVYIHYFDGYSIHGEFWNRKISYTALGFNLDL